MVPPFIFKSKELLLGWEFDPVNANIIFLFSLNLKFPIEVSLISCYQSKENKNPKMSWEKWNFLKSAKKQTEAVGTMLSPNNYIGKKETLYVACFSGMLCPIGALLNITSFL